MTGWIDGYAPFNTLQGHTMIISILLRENIPEIAEKTPSYGQVSGECIRYILLSTRLSSLEIHLHRYDGMNLVSNQREYINMCAFFDKN